ncbi:tyrosine-protein phosphatase Lar-like [Mytilus californianus]|uniref:tyrosine-protein phosphatase Lar-like n=1 Tax=Mytilus californianus TaxID=6549 RepID=UPI0022485144|nr:tyrosine-protein phosphatase Lar-like [Mytilus californianus]
MSSMSYEINQLLPYTYYDVWINAINAAGDGNRSETPIETDSEVPQKPFDVIASVASSSEITVTWKQPKPRPGVTTYYVKVFEVIQNAKPVFLKIANVTGFGTQTLHFTGLEAYLNYTCSVVAATDKGSSEQSDMSVAVTTKQDTQSLVSPKGYTIQTVVGAAVGCVIFGGLVVGLLFYTIRRKNFNSKQSRAKQTPEELQIGGQYEEIGMDNASFYQELRSKDNSNTYEQIDTMHTVDKQYENITFK